MLARVEPGGRVVRMMSLPRDTRVSLPSRGWRKLNAALPMLGADGLVRAVTDLTGVRVDGYVLINLAGVRALTDAVGGVSLYLPRALDYDDFAGKLHVHLRPGVRRLDGAQAEGFVRFRHDALGDVGRTQRHQAYVRAVARRLLSPAGLTYLPAVSRVVTSSVRTNLTASQVGALLGAMTRAPRVETLLLPGRFLTSGGVSYWEMDRLAARGPLRAMGSVRVTAPPDPRTLRVAVVSLGASAADLVSTREKLRRAGFSRVFESRRGVPAGRSSAVLVNGDAGAAEAVR
ncbi:LCP family protein, partial [Deinococcus pimensis]|uniref:LCP family protein n=1 Tax=Deinococcus pimensis TaxID=309888 RepID=UPI000694EF79